MRIVSALLLVLALVAAQPASAQGAVINIFCEDCRDLNENPEDARNFAVNQVFGSDSWLDWELADRFDITDPYGNTVTADVNMSFVYWDLPDIDIPVPLPSALIIQVRIIYENGNVFTYAYDTRDLDPNGSLPVGGSGTVTPPDTTGNNNDDEEDDWSEDEEDNWNDDDDDGWGDDDWDDDDWGDDGDCGGCEAYFDGDEDGDFDDEATDWTEEEEEL